MKCKKCGNEFSIGIFCPECGTKYDEVESKVIEEQKRNDELKNRVGKEQEEKTARELELAKEKTKQDQMAREKAEMEAEALRLKNENMRLEKQKEEEQTRTFNGVLYSSVEEMSQAKKKYDAEKEQQKVKKNANINSIVSLITAIAVYPLVITVILWFPAYIVSIVCGVIALKRKTEKKGIAIVGLVIDGVFLLIIIWSVIFS